MAKRVLDVGNCGLDHSSIRALIENHFDAEVEQAHAAGDSLARLREAEFDLVLVNRKLDQDYSDGLEVIQQIKADRQLRSIPCMLVTNHAQHQHQAVESGAELGFGKLELQEPQTRAKLEKFLS